MVEENRDSPKQDEDIIVIEEGEGEQEEQKEELKEEESPSPKEKEPKKRSKLPLLGVLGGLAVAIVIVAAALLLLHKKQPTPKPKKPKVTVNKPTKKPKRKKKAVQAYNPIVDVHFVNAMRLQEKGKYKQALEQLKRATTDLYVSYYGIGYIYLQMGNLKKAREYLFDRTKNYLLLAVHNNPHYTNGYVNLFRIYMATGDYKDAKEMISALESINPSSKDIPLMKTYYNYIVDNETSGLFDLLAEYPNSPLLLSLAGDYYLKQNNARTAKEYFEKALRLYPMGGVYYNLALIETQNNNYKQALKNVPKMYYMDFSKIPCKNYLAFLLLLRENKFKAAEKFLKLNKQANAECFSHFKIVPTVYSPLTLKNYSIRMNFNYLLAAEILNAYLKPVNLLPGKAVPQIKLGLLYQQLGIPQKAAKEFEQAANFSEAVLLSEYANKFYIQGDYKTALNYYQSALSKAPTNPLLSYNVALLELKLHNYKLANVLFSRLINAYSLFPLPYLGMFIVEEAQGKHMDAMKYLDTFSQRVKSLGKDAQDKLKDLSIFSDYIIDRVNFKQDRLKNLNDFQKKVFLLFEAALDEDLDYLAIQRDFERQIHLNWDATSLVTLCNYFYTNYQNDYLRRLMSTMYLIDGKPEKAYEAMYNITSYSAEDYYKLGCAYLLAGYPEVADNFFTKSILKGSNFFNAYVGKAIIQASKGSLTGTEYYLNIILKKQPKFAWLNTDVNLSYRIELK